MLEAARSVRAGLIGAKGREQRTFQQGLFAGALSNRLELV